MSESQQEKLERLRRELQEAEAAAQAERESLRRNQYADNTGRRGSGGDSFNDGLGSPSAARKQTMVASHKLPPAFHLPEIKAPSKMARQRSEANALTTEILSAAGKREIAARERLNKLKARAQRELARAASLQAIEEQRERRRMQVAQVKKKNDELVGRDVMLRAKAVEPLGEDETFAWSKLFNERLRALQPGGMLGGGSGSSGSSSGGGSTSKLKTAAVSHAAVAASSSSSAAVVVGDARSFYQLFKEMDIDGSRRISFFELERMIREKLKLNEKMMPKEKMYALWRRLDENESGYIDAGELSRFLRIGAPKTLTPAQLAKQRLQAERERQFAEAKAEAAKRQAKDVAAKAAELPRAGREDIMSFGALFSKHLSDLRPRGQDSLSHYSLFRQMDTDGSGHVRFDEFERMVRHGLKCDLRALPGPKLWSLWRSIDENENGFICAGEFGRFMRTASEGAEGKAAPRAATEQKLREDREVKHLRQEEQWARTTAKSSMEVAAAMEAEAARLEALLSAAGVGAGGGGGGGGGPKRSRSSAALLPEQRQQQQQQSGSPQRPPPAASSSAGGGGGGEGGGGGGGGGGAEVEEEIAEEIHEKADAFSPVKRKEMLTMLRREIRKGGSHSRTKPTAMRGGVSMPLLRSFAKEEGQI